MWLSVVEIIDSPKAELIQRTPCRCGESKMKKWVILFTVAVVLLGMVIATKTSGVVANPGRTTQCESCHTYPPSSIHVTTDITATTVAPGQTFTVNISWSGGAGRRIEINWSDYGDNSLFNPSPRIPYSGKSSTGSTASTLTAPSTTGSYNVRVYAARKSPLETDYQNITITVNNVNQPPVLSPIGNKAVNEGQLLTFTISASDPGSDTLTYSASNLPSGASFSRSTGSFSWRPSAGQYGVYPDIRFRVSDGTLTTSERITITVDMPDTVAPEIFDVSISDTLPRSTVIRWTTDEQSTSQAEYGVNQRLLSTFVEKLVTIHTIRLTDLIPGSSYSFQVLSGDEAGNIAASAEYSFNTPPAFIVSEITVTPGEASIGEQVTVSVYVTNNLDITGSNGFVIKVKIQISGSSFGLQNDTATVEEITTHELGHALGLGHHTNQDDLMGTTVGYEGGGPSSCDLRGFEEVHAWLTDGDENIGPYIIGYNSITCS